MTYRLSSTFTLFYKYVFTGVVIVSNLVLIFLCCFVFPSNYRDLYVLVPLLLLGTTAAVFPLFKLEVVDYSETHVIIHKGSREVLIPFRQVQQFRRSLIYFFKITYLDDQQASKSVMIMPKVREFKPMLGLRNPSYDRLKAFLIKSNK